MYPLATEHIGDEIPVAVMCRVLRFTRQPYHHWPAGPIADRDLDEAYLANVLVDAQLDDAKFGHRLLGDKADKAGTRASDGRGGGSAGTTAVGRRSARSGRRTAIVHSDRGSQFRSRKVLREVDRHALLGSTGQIASAGDNAAIEYFPSLLQKRPKSVPRAATPSQPQGAMD